MMKENRLRVPMMRDESYRPGAPWPSLDVIDPPGWLADAVGKDFPREFFDNIGAMLSAEGYEFCNHRKAWIFSAIRSRGAKN